MKRLLTPLLGFALSVGLSAVQAETVWNFATAYKDNNFHTQNIARFVGEVEENSDGKLKMAMHTNASLLKMPEIKRGVQTGQVQIGEIPAVGLRQGRSLLRGRRHSVPVAGAR